MDDGPLVLAKALFVSDIMSDMKKTVTLRSLHRDAALLDIAAEGEEIVVTRFGKPYVRIIPAKQLVSWVWDASGQKAPVSSEPIPVSEWNLTLITTDSGIRDARVCAVEYYAFKPSRPARRR